MGALELQTNYAKTLKGNWASKWPFLNMFLLVFNLNLLLFQFNPIYPGSLPSGHTD